MADESFENDVEEQSHQIGAGLFGLMEATEQVGVSKHDVAFFGADLFRNKGSVVVT